MQTDKTHFETNGAYLTFFKILHSLMLRPQVNSEALRTPIGPFSICHPAVNMKTSLLLNLQQDCDDMHRLYKKAEHPQD